MQSNWEMLAQWGQWFAYSSTRNFSLGQQRITVSRPIHAIWYVLTCRIQELYIHTIIFEVKKYIQMVCWLCITSNSHPAKWCAWWNRGAIQYAANIYGRDAQTYCQGAEGAAYCFIIRGAQVARTESVGVLLLLWDPNPSQSQPLPGGPARQLYKDRDKGKGNEMTKTIVKYCQQCSEL